MDVIPKGCLKGIGIPTESLWRGELLRPKSQWSTGKRCLPKDGERSGGSEELCKELKRPAREKDQESALTAAKPESSVGPSQKCQHAGAFLGLGSPLSPILSPVVVRHSASEQLRRGRKTRWENRGVCLQPRCVLQARLLCTTAWPTVQLKREKSSCSTTGQAWRYSFLVRMVERHDGQGLDSLLSDLCYVSPLLWASSSCA